MFYLVQGANNGFLTQGFLPHYVSHSANSKQVQRGELGPYSRLKHSNHIEAIQNHPYGLPKGFCKKACPKSRSIWCQGIFFPIHPLHSISACSLKRVCQKYYSKLRTIQPLNFIQQHPVRVCPQEHPIATHLPSSEPSQ